MGIDYTQEQREIIIDVLKSALTIETSIDQGWENDYKIYTRLMLDGECISESCDDLPRPRASW